MMEARWRGEKWDLSLRVAVEGGERISNLKEMVISSDSVDIMLVFSFKIMLFRINTEEGATRSAGLEACTNCCASST